MSPVPVAVLAACNLTKFAPGDRWRSSVPHRAANRDPNQPLAASRHLRERPNLRLTSAYALVMQVWPSGGPAA